MGNKSLTYLSLASQNTPRSKKHFWSILEAWKNKLLCPTLFLWCLWSHAANAKLCGNVNLRVLVDSYQFHICRQWRRVDICRWSRGEPRGPWHRCPRSSIPGSHTCSLLWNKEKNTTKINKISKQKFSTVSVLASERWLPATGPSIQALVLIVSFGSWELATKNQ